MREFGIILALCSVAIGGMLFFAPNSLVKLGEQTNKLYNVDGLIYRNRIWFGILLLLAGSFLVYSTV